MSSRSTWFLFLLAPLVVGALFVGIEHALFNQDVVEDALEGQVPETIKQVVALNNDLAKLFISLSTALIGGVAYYLKFAYREFTQHTAFARTAAAGTVLFAALSIFFGHLWVAGMRNQLANDYFNYGRPELLWPERLQYYSFIVALCWFAVLALEREQVRANGEERR